MFRKLGTLLLILMPCVAMADTFTVSGNGFTSVNSNGHMEFVSDFNGNLLGMSPEYGVLFVGGSSVKFNLGYTIPTNATVTSATLTISRSSLLNVAMNSQSTQLPPYEDLGCASDPCPFTAGQGMTDIFLDGVVLANVGSHLVYLDPWDLWNVSYSPMAQGLIGAQFTGTDTLSFDLVALGWLDVLNGSQILEITGENYLTTDLNYYSWGVGAWTSLDLDVTRYQTVTATLDVDYTVPVPEPATMTLMMAGIGAGVLRMRRSLL